MLLAVCQGRDKRRLGIGHRGNAQFAVDPDDRLAVSLVSR